MRFLTLAMFLALLAPSAGCVAESSPAGTHTDEEEIAKRYSTLFLAGKYAEAGELATSAMQVKENAKAPLEVLLPISEMQDRAVGVQ